MPREELFHRSMALGLDVVATVTSKTAVLVTNDLSSGTRKAETDRVASPSRG